MLKLSAPIVHIPLSCDEIPPAAISILGPLLPRDLAPATAGVVPPVPPDSVSRQEPALTLPVVASLEPVLPRGSPLPLPSVLLGKRKSPRGDDGDVAAEVENVAPRACREKWTCRSCTFVNRCDLRECTMCGTDMAPVKKIIPRADGSWVWRRLAS